jgi:hypothetical protein
MSDSRPAEKKSASKPAKGTKDNPHVVGQFWDLSDLPEGYSVFYTVEYLTEKGKGKAKKQVWEFHDFAVSPAQAERARKHLYDQLVGDLEDAFYGKQTAVKQEFLQFAIDGFTSPESVEKFIEKVQTTAKKKADAAKNKDAQKFHLTKDQEPKVRVRKMLVNVKASEVKPPAKKSAAKKTAKKGK